MHVVILVEGLGRWLGGRGLSYRCGQVLFVYGFSRFLMVSKRLHTGRKALRFRGLLFVVEAVVSSIRPEDSNGKQCKLVLLLP